MPTLATIVQQLAATLADDEPQFEHCTWSESELAGYFQEGLCLAAMYRRDLFTKVETLPLKSCQGIQTFDGCTVIRVFEFVDANGCTIAINPGTNPKVLAAQQGYWIGPSCVSSGVTSPRTALVIDGTNGVIRVDPPPPEGVTWFVKVECFKPPPTFDTNDMTSEVSSADCVSVVAARMWALFRALGKEFDGQGHVQLAQMYLQAFSTMMGTAFKLADYQRKLTAIEQQAKK